ncbi:MAG: T9SS type A sorting domain-containing protein, partial [Bacteroidales bacterium]
VWENKMGETRYGYYMKNFKQTDGNYYVANGWSEVIDTTIPFVNYPGWIFKFDQNGDSIWFRDYHHFNNMYANNYLFDVSETSDKGYIGIGQSNEAFTQSNMWVIKLDSMGCDTPGCINTVIDEGLVVNGEGLRVWPNPARERFFVLPPPAPPAGGRKTVALYNWQGVKVKEVDVPEGAESVEVDVSGYEKGLYFLQYIHSGKVSGPVKVVVQ